MAGEDAARESHLEVAKRRTHAKARTFAAGGARGADGGGNLRGPPGRSGRGRVSSRPPPAPARLLRGPGRPDPKQPVNTGAPGVLAPKTHLPRASGKAAPERAGPRRCGSEDSSAAGGAHWPRALRLPFIGARLPGGEGQRLCGPRAPPTVRPAAARPALGPAPTASAQIASFGNPPAPRGVRPSPARYLNGPPGGSPSAAGPPGRARAAPRSLSQAPRSSVKTFRSPPPQVAGCRGSPGSVRGTQG